MTNKIDKGFTLIELMVVVAIIGILASISLPPYQNYISRSKIAEALTLTASLKKRSVEFYEYTGRFPASNEEAGVPAPDKLLGNYVSGVEITDGAIHITMGNKAGPQLDSKVLTLRPITVIDSPESPTSWLCGIAKPPQGMEPVGEDRTNVEGMLLPQACRV